MYIYKFAVLVLLASITVVYTNCGSPFATQSQLAFMNSQPLAGSQEAFEATVYPITRANCVSCHQTQSPQHASADPVVAHAAAYSKVNFGNIPNSRLVQKLRTENHNCWSDCNANADEMQAAIEEWYAAVEATDKANPTPVIPSPTAQMFKTAQTRSLDLELADPSNPAKTPTAEAKVATATLSAPMVKATDGFGDYIYVPDDGSNQTLLVTDNSAGIATMNIRLPSAGSYRVWAQVLNPDANSNAVFIGLAPQGTTNYIGGLRSVTNIATNANPTYRQLLTGINVTTAGNYTLTIREQKDGLKIYKLFVTADTTFNGMDVASFIGIQKSFDVSSFVDQAPGSVKFIIDISDYSNFTYLVSNPRLAISGQNIRVKNLRLFMNNVYNPQNSTYTIVDKVVTPADLLISGFPMVVPKDQPGTPKDKFHFEFEMFEVYAGTVNNASLTAFQNSVYPISRANCASCHTAQTPAHASPDPLTAHDAALTVVDFNNPANSRIVTKIRNGHQSINATTGASLATQYEAAIVQWRTGRGP